jgi:hypothetical protein
LPEALRCRYCDRDVAADFAFCPYCGTQLWTYKDDFTFVEGLWGYGVLYNGLRNFKWIKCIHTF